MPSYPEIEKLTLAECRGALVLGHINIGSLTPEGQANLKPRLVAIAARIAKLEKRSNRAKCIVYRIVR